MATSASKKPSTKKKASRAKTKTGAKKKAAAKKSAARKKAPAKRSIKLEEVEELVDDLELETQSPEETKAPVVPRATAVSDAITSRAGSASVRSRDITNFLRQLIMMLEAGTSILKALRSIARRGENKGTRQMVSGIAEYVESGNPLWQAFAREPKHFSPVFVNLIKVAEATGMLPTVLRRLVEYREERERLQRYVQVALIYPGILVTVSLGLIIVLSVFVIPAFRDIFDQLGAEMNWYSNFIMDAADVVAAWWWLFVLGLIGLVAVYNLYWVKSPVRHLQADKVKLKVPVYRNILRKRVIADFMRTFAMLIRSGISMMATLDLCKNGVGNRAYIGVIQDMRDSVEAGEGLEAPLREAEKDGYIPGVVVDMLLTGEESGSLEQVADQIAETYEMDVELAVNGLKEAITPLFVVAMGFSIGSIVIGMFLPLISMIENIAGGPM